LQRDDYLKPDEVYRFDIALGPRQWAINPDHRLRLELTTQSPADVCPPADLPPKNEPNPCRLTAPQQVTVPGATYKILYGAKWPSALNLPQLPWKSFTEVRSGVPPTAWSENQRKLETRDITLPLDWGK
jgi:predicted acyl esterase